MISNIRHTMVKFPNARGFEQVPLSMDNSSFLAKDLFLFQFQFENRVQATLAESEYGFSKFLVAYGMETPLRSGRLQSRDCVTISTYQLAYDPIVNEFTLIMCPTHNTNAFSMNHLR